MNKMFQPYNKAWQKTFPSWCTGRYVADILILVHVDSQQEVAVEKDMFESMHHFIVHKKHVTQI